MNKNLRWIVLGCATLGMGLSMPSCPGQQAMQQQIDALEKRVNSETQRVQSLDTQVKQLNGEMAKANQLLSTMGNTVLAQKTEIENLQKSVQEMASRSAAKPAAKAAPAKHAAPAKKLPAKKKR